MRIIEKILNYFKEREDEAKDGYYEYDLLELSEIIGINFPDFDRHLSFLLFSKLLEHKNNSLKITTKGKESLEEMKGLKIL